MDENPLEPQQTTNNKSAINYKLISIGAIAIAVILLALVLILIINNHDDKQEAEPTTPEQQAQTTDPDLAQVAQAEQPPPAPGQAQVYILISPEDIDCSRTSYNGHNARSGQKICTVGLIIGASQGQRQEFAIDDFSLKMVNFRQAEGQQSSVVVNNPVTYRATQALNSDLARQLDQIGSSTDKIDIDSQLVFEVPASSLPIELVRPSPWSAIEYLNIIPSECWQDRTLQLGLAVNDCRYGINLKQLICYTIVLKTDLVDSEGITRYKQLCLARIELTNISNNHSLTSYTPNSHYFNTYILGLSGYSIQLESRRNSRAVRYPELRTADNDFNLSDWQVWDASDDKFKEIGLPHDRIVPSQQSSWDLGPGETSQIASFVFIVDEDSDLNPSSKAIYLEKRAHPYLPYQAIINEVSQGEAARRASASPSDWCNLNPDQCLQF